MGEGERGMGAECGDDGGDLLLGALGDTKWWPPGFRFHPTDEELVLYYLKRKVCRRRIRLPMIGDVDVYKWEPWELPEKSVLRSGDKQWYFFSPRDRKYPNGSRSNRSTGSGYWKATGKDRTISQNKSMAVGNKKTLVYYRGRPPRGERTDWVMHEYTLDEQVLMRCNNVQDSYALYKVFRKSGPGPKNGEEYGAPFREEEWNDPDDCLRNQVDTVDLICDHPHSNSVTEPMLGNDRNTVPIDDLEDFLLQMSSEQVTTQTLGLPYIDVAVEVGSHTLGPPYIDDATSTKQNGAWCDQFSTPTSFHVPPPTCVYTQPIAAPDVESPVANDSEQGHLETSEEFLEIKDFNDPDPTVWSINDISINDISHKDHVPDADEIFDPYDYFDANMYLAEAMVPLDGFNGDETHNQASHMISELWTHEQPLIASAAVELEQVAMASPASGAVWDSSSLVSLGGGGPQGEISHAGSESDSWFNSALAAFLETIPSSPAMASENALLSRALERVSSFKAGRIGARDHDPDTTTAGGGAVAGRRQGGHNRGLLFLSFLVGLGAVAWVLIIGASVKALKCLWGRFSTS